MKKKRGAAKLKTKRTRASTRTRVNLLDWMQLEPGEELKPAKERIYSLIPEQREVLEQWARNGCTKEEIAKEIGVNLSTLRVWERKCPELIAALKKGRACAHARVENALFMKAVGYTIVRQQPVKKKISDYDGLGKKTGEHEEIEIQEIIEHVPPDMGAIAFYLKNNMPEKYRDKWPEIATDDGEEERENMCLKDFTKAVAKAVITESKQHG